MSRFIGDDRIDWDSEAERSIKQPMRVDGDSNMFDYMKKHLKEGMLCLDLGCNIGRWVYVFLAYGLKYEGLDASPTAIKYAREIFPDLTFHHMNALNMTFKNKYDLVFTNTVMQHIRTANQERIFIKIHTALKPDGIFIMREKDDVDGGTHHDMATWIDLLYEAGFELVEYIPFTAKGTNTSTYIMRKKW